jgi:hypothetical protein
MRYSLKSDCCGAGYIKKKIIVFVKNVRKDV